MADADAKTELATERTEYAEDRTMLANERTFAGWLRTGLGAVAVGLAFNALFERMHPAWIPKAIATAFIAIGILIFVVARRNASAVLKRLNAHEIRPAGSLSLNLMAWPLSVGAAALIAALWLLRLD